MGKLPSADESGRRHTKTAVRSGTPSHGTISGFHDRPHGRCGAGSLHWWIPGWHPGSESYQKPVTSEKEH